MRRTLTAFVLGLVLVAAVPVFGNALRDSAQRRCSNDGLALKDAPVVRVVDEAGKSRSFCCVGCAETWLKDSACDPVRVLVTDEVTRVELDTADAWFVRSLVPAHPPTLDHVHTFRARMDAEHHARAYRGRVLVGDERPLRARSRGAHGP